jgi:hypothetical protein
LTRKLRRAKNLSTIYCHSFPAKISLPQWNFDGPAFFWEMHQPAIDNAIAKSICVTWRNLTAANGHG